jgi:hypothetical protein
LLWSGVNAVGRENLRTSGKVLTDTSDTDTRPRDIIAILVGEGAQNFVQKLRGRGSKRAALPRIPSKKMKKIKLIKRDIFS